MKEFHSESSKQEKPFLGFLAGICGIAGGGMYEIYLYNAGADLEKMIYVGLGTGASVLLAYLSVREM